MRRVNITLGDDVYDDLEYLQNREKITKSQLIRDAIRSYKEELEKKDIEAEKKRKIKVAISRINKIRENTGFWDGAKEIRRFRDSRAKDY